MITNLFQDYCLQYPWMWETINQFEPLTQLRLFRLDFFFVNILSRITYWRFSFGNIWRVNIFPKITFFALEVGCRCILTIDRFMRKGNILMNGCYLCKRADETCNYILPWCPLAYKLWSMTYGLLDIN